MVQKIISKSRELIKFLLDKKWISVIPAFLGLGFILLAVFAVQFGFDHTPAWGGKRIFTFALGIFLLLSSFLFYRAGRHASWLKDHYVSLEAGLFYTVSGFCILFVLGAYVWFVSAGRWTTWPATSNYYDRLATAFRQGQLDINIQLDPALPKLQDPYDPEARKDIQGLDNIWDMSLYNGKIYIYFGAAPALVLIPLKFLYPGPIGDQTLTFVFISGLFVFESLLIFVVWRRFFSDITCWTIILGIFVVGLAHPVPWMLADPRIYETAVAAGQFFLVGGFFFAFTALDRFVPSVWRWVLAGTFWSFAVGTRAILVIPVIFMTLMVLWQMGCVFYKPGEVRRFFQPFLAMALPMVISAIVIGGYNWARFGSALEAGLRYQIGMTNLNRYSGDIFSISHVLPNFYIYLVNPPAIADVFPFIRPIRADQIISHFNNSSPGIYNSERITGIVYSAPFILFAVIPAATAFANLFLKWQKRDAVEDVDSAQSLLQWTVFSMIGSFALTLISLLLYFYGTVRYLLEIIPFTVILAMIGFWQGYRFLRNRRLLHALYVTFLMGLAAVSIMAGVFLSFSSDVQRIKSGNPSLLHHLILFFMKLTKRFGF